jgi:hypothetical protein
MDILCMRGQPGENGLQVFNVEIHAPEVGKNSRMDKTAVKGSKWDFELFLTV